MPTAFWAFYFLLFGLPFWAAWYVHLVPVTQLASRQRDRLVMYLAPPVSWMVLCLAVLGNRADWQASVPCCCAGAMTLALAVWLLPWLGLSPRDDVAERRNRAAGWAIGGALIGLALAFGCAAGATIAALGGMTVGQTGVLTLTAGLIGVLALIALFACYGLLEGLTDFAEAITVERDAGAALRLAALLPALGLLLGESFPLFWTWPDGWKPLSRLLAPLILLAMAIPVERWRNCTARLMVRPRSSDVVIACSYLASASIWAFLAR